MPCDSRGARQQQFNSKDSSHQKERAGRVSLNPTALKAARSPAYSLLLMRRQGGCLPLPFKQPTVPPNASGDATIGIGDDAVPVRPVVTPFAVVTLAIGKGHD